MVGRRRKARPLAGNHQRCWTWGRNAVLEGLRAGLWLPMEVLGADRTDAVFRQSVESLAHSRGVPVRWVPYDDLTNRCRSTEHQGLMAMMPTYPYAKFNDLKLPTDRPAFVLLLEGIQDPFNFGAIIRSAEVFGADAIVVGETGQCDVTPHVARASAGAVNHVTIARAANAAEAASALRKRGLKVFGATGHTEREIAACSLREASTIAIGNEGAGLSAELQAACDELVRIPQIGQTESLNAAVAAGILCYELRRQRLAR